MKPLLSISIPTYNRAWLLKKTLDALMEQIDENALHKDVEIVISDNASSDNTQEYINSLIALNKYNIVYNRNAQNLGVIKNILKLVEFSSAKYWMFYGDDDVIPKGQLKALINTFKNYDKQSVFMFRWKNDNFCNHLSHGTLLSPNQLATDFFYYIGNAGIFAVETSYAKQSVKNYEADMINTCWPQTMIVFMSMYALKQPQILYVDLISSETPDVPVIRSNSYYLFETALYALLRTGLSIEKNTNVSFMEYAVHSVDGIKYFKEHKQVIIENYLYYDSEKQKNDFDNAVRKAHNEIPERYRKEINEYYQFVRALKYGYVIRFYLNYVKQSFKKNISASFMNRLKIYSPYGYYRSIVLARKEQAELKQILKREEVSAGSGYF